MGQVVVHAEVEAALREGRPVVAMETAVLTHGLPRSRLLGGPPNSIADDFDPERPTNLATVRLMGARVLDAGATPAVVAVIDGELRIGLDDPELERLAINDEAAKASVGNLASIMAAGRSAGTTVSATLLACGLAPGGPIRVFATGGIGGVHLEWTDRPDISADLRQLATTPTCVVCAGAKSVLDLPATVEAMETLGVPVVGYRTDGFPQFHSAGNDSIACTQQVDDAAEAAALCRTQWETLGRREGVLLAQNPPAEDAMPIEEIEIAVERAEREADHQEISGRARTPFLLERLTAITGGRALKANIALLVRNAELAAEVAVEMGE